MNRFPLIPFREREREREKVFRKKMNSSTPLPCIYDTHTSISIRPEQEALFSWDDDEDGDGGVTNMTKRRRRRERTTLGTRDTRSSSSLTHKHTTHFLIFFFCAERMQSPCSLFQPLSLISQRQRHGAAPRDCLRLQHNSCLITRERERERERGKRRSQFSFAAASNFLHHLIGLSLPT